MARGGRALGGGSTTDNNVAQPRRMLNNNRVSAGVRDGYQGLVIMAVLYSLRLSYCSRPGLACDARTHARTHAHTHAYAYVHVCTPDTQIVSD